MRGSLTKALASAMRGDLPACESALASIPRAERAFKGPFDAFSEPVAYKERYKEANAFVVYYTQGFDGPGRARMGTREEEEQDPRMVRQAQQYGLRNEAWVAFDAGLADLEYLRATGAPEDLPDLVHDLQNAVDAVSKFIELGEQG